MSKILVTLGPASLNYETIKQMEQEGVHLFRINLSHANLDSLEELIAKIQKWTDVPVCLDSEGAQIRNQSMGSGSVNFQKGKQVRIHFDKTSGDSNSISFTPTDIAKAFIVGDKIRVDFDKVCMEVVERNNDHCLARITHGGEVGSKKAVDILGRKLELPAITEKDREAIRIGRKLGIKHFALSFAGSCDDVNQMRSLAGSNSTIISKIESIDGLKNLHAILEASDQILIDRGDLSRQVPIEKIPFLQRKIISLARLFEKPVFVATNLLETMVKNRNPTRAEMNDIVSTILMGADGLVLAAETAIGVDPVAAVKTTATLVNNCMKWTPNTSLEEVLDYM
jgi:pyruvate kinase